MIGSRASSVEQPGEAPNSGRKRPASSTGTSTGRSWTRRARSPPSPQPGAMWTMPVPSSSATSSHGMTRCSTPCCAGDVVERAVVAPARRAPRRASRRPTRVRRRAPSPTTRRAACARTPRRGWTAAATFAGSVHGVVVQTTSDSPSRSSSGKRTYSDGCVSSAYLSSPACSCCDSDVPQRGHHCVERWPL